MADPFLQELKREVVLHPENANLRYRLAEALFAERDFQNAVKQLEKLLTLAPEDGNARRLLTRAYERDGKLAMAVKTLDDAIKRNPSDASFRDEMVELLLAAGRPDDAMLHAEAAVQVAPQDPNRLSMLGELLFRKRHYERARQVLERAQRLNPHDEKLAQLLKDLYLEMGDEAAVDRVAGKRDRDYFVKQTVAALELPSIARFFTGALKEAAGALKQKDPAGAKRALVSASADDKASPAFPFLRGELLLWEQDFDRAEAAFKAAVERKADFGVAWNRLGDLHQSRGQLKESVPFYERAVNSTPDDANAWEDLGDIFSTLGELERAKEAYQKAAALVPSGKASDKLASLDRAPKLVTDAPVVGRIHALGWNPHGGAVSPLQAAAIPGNGQLIFSGNVGPVGKEAGQVAFSCLKARAIDLGILEQVRTHDLHLHFEDSEFTKEGPSAGLALVLVGISAYTGRTLKGALAASGEISLHGEVRQVGGIHEKMVAAKLYGIKTVLVPRRNLRDVRELPQEVRDAIEFIHVDTVSEALQKVLQAK